MVIIFAFQASVPGSIPGRRINTYYNSIICIKKLYKNNIIFIPMFLTITYALLSINNINNILPPINNIYYTAINIPFAGKQNIIYERREKLLSELKLSGKVNVNGYIYFNENNPREYTLDDNLKYIIKKYKCSLYDPIYDKKKDIISFKIRLNLIRYTKFLTLHKVTKGL